jgi:membrane-associated phospholipid phosphatase
MDSTSAAAGRKRRLLTLAGFGCLALVVLLGVAVGPRASGPDQRMESFLRGPLDQRPYRRAVTALASETGWPHGSYGLALLPVLMALTLLAHDAVRGNQPPRLRRWTWLLISFAAVPLQHALRVAFDRTGPGVSSWADGPRGAYPSGAALLVALGWAIGVVVAGDLRPRWRAVTMAGAAAALGLHAAARVSAQKHWATDILGSYLLAGGVLLIAAALPTRRPG